ncbi:transcription factor A, mitochondrial [Lampris incognitus]|uniref:transcription factor A, mitochondrial n=1 Tax=Lampris incognitus TaxID=2546036 RepID=UPI0024B61E5B|nr:transcription factor A, mitochondrial [Lampris incognitus]
MAPNGFMTAGVKVLAKAFSVFCPNTLARSTSVLPAPYLVTWMNFTSQVATPPKRPMNAYLRYLKQQRPVFNKQQPDLKHKDVLKKVAEEWKIMTTEQKKPFEDVSQREWEQFKVDFQQYRARLTPAQSEELALMRKQRLAKKKAIIKKRELNMFGKPKRARSAFNIFMSEQFEEAKGVTAGAKLKSVVEGWNNLFGQQKQVYKQLAEDDKIRYKNEMQSWEVQMREIGREDLIQEKSQNAPRAKAAKGAKSEVQGVKKKTASGKSKTAGGKKPGSSKTVRKTD